MVDAPKSTVLVVEDEFLVRLDLAQRLEQAGYHVREASNAAEAIDILAKDSTIRVVFTDIQMPGTMNGIGLSHYIRKRWPPTILIVCSATPPNASELPFNTEFMEKPVGNNTLDRVLQAIERNLADRPRQTP